MANLYGSISPKKDLPNQKPTDIMCVSSYANGSNPSPNRIATNQSEEEYPNEKGSRTGSFVCHEYFRRILCRLLGQWVEDGQFPDEPETLAEIVRGISYENAKQYFRFPL